MHSDSYQGAGKLVRLIQSAYKVSTLSQGVPKEGPGSPQEFQSDVRPIPEAVQTTMRAFEKLIRLDEERRQSLLVEVSDFAVRHQMNQFASETRRFVFNLLEPKFSEIAALDRRLSLIRGKLADLEERWLHERAEDADEAQATADDLRLSVHA